MILLRNAPDNLIEQRIQSLKENKVAESKILEYKQSLLGDSNDGKREFLADISSFANAEGGNIIFGISEDKGIPIDIVGLEIEDPDKTVDRLSNLLRDSIEPRIPGIDIRAIKLSSGQTIIIFYIPKSFNSPHVVRLGSHNWRFYSRHSTGKYPLEVAELRTMFISSATVKEKLRNFRLDRISQVKSLNLQIPVSPGPKFIYHLVPLSAISTGSD